VKRLADDVWQLGGVPPDAINVYLVGDVVIDAATRLATKRILRQLRGHAVGAHALTHAHPDHQGASHALCETLEIPFWVGAADVAPAQEPRLIFERQPVHPINKVSFTFWAGPGHPVDRVLNEGDEVAGFQVLHTPGHSEGHVSFWRESDRILILGDVLNAIHVFTGLPGLHEPPAIFTPDPATNRRSARRLAELEPALVLFGHGPPLRDTNTFVDFVNALPA
jgi:glyoxylase-like metal-dependent hydrolase (beta-lactamase superfamily II)